MMKLNILLTTVLGLVAAKTVVSSEVEGNLRGGDAFADLERDLASAGSSSRSLSFTVASARKSDSFCLDFYSTCLEYADAYTGTLAGTDASGNTEAVSDAHAELWANSCCSSFAQAFAQTCAFTKVDGKVNVKNSVTNNLKTVEMDVTLTAATMTIALADTVAIADTYASVGSYAYTDAESYCSTIDRMSIYCGAVGGSSSGITTLATANAASVGKAGALAGTQTSTTAAVYAQGTGINYINSVISTYAKSWSIAAAASAVSTFAESYSSVYGRSYTSVCIEQHKKMCGANPGIDICQSGPDVACATAYATYNGYAEAIAEACAAAFAAAIAITVTDATLSANVDCRSTPIFTWKCLPANTDTTCAA